jgi:hypothetical protein
MLSLHHVEPFARRLDLSLPFLTAYLRLTVQRIVLCRAGTEDKASKLNVTEKMSPASPCASILVPAFLPGECCSRATLYCANRH